ncbi:serine-rich adhesin for platelets-like [Cotesia glomerata]|nr:serine-rich adhesin for platelets-like [Cotesia glomerata]
MRELKPIRSHSVLATLADDDHPKVDNDVRPQEIMGENEEQKLKVSNGHNEIKNGTEDKTIEENSSNPINNFDQLSVENNFDDIAKQLELLSQKENEIQRQRRALLEKMSEKATQQRITSEFPLEKKSNESDYKNPFKNNSNDPVINKPSYSLTLERSFVPVESEIDLKLADVVANNPPKAAFELSSHLQSSAWNVVTKSKLNSSNSSTTSKISTPKSAEVPVAHPIVQPVAQLATQTPSIEENSSVTPSSEWTTVSRSRRGSNLVDSTRKLQTSRESSPIPEAVWRRATGLKKMSSSESQSISSSVHETTSWRKLDDLKEPLSTTESVQLNVEKLHEASSEHKDLTWPKVAAQKEPPSTLKLKSWNNSESREISPEREETPWNKVATLRETSIMPESTPWTVMTRSKKVSSSQQCTQWKLAPETVETIEFTGPSTADMIDSLKKSKFSHLVSSDKDSKSNETLPASGSSLIDSKPKVKPVLRDSSEKSTLVSRTITPSSVSSSYSTMAKITKDKPSENPTMKTMSSSNEFLPIPRRSKISSLLNSQILNRFPAPGAGRGIIHTVDEMKHKKNDILSRRLRPGSASSFCSSFDQIDIEGVYGYEETV